MPLAKFVAFLLLVGICVLAVLEPAVAFPNRGYTRGSLSPPSKDNSSPFNEVFFVTKFSLSSTNDFAAPDSFQKGHEILLLPGTKATLSHKTMTSSWNFAHFFPLRL
ncbi:hypothetical protein DFJ73DRAFT_966207 [Zopfochytrium polystomum]|nr:hypothetical protein DFJ73DRAFT_966207 [Zopfochytrium polystomum]